MCLASLNASLFDVLGNMRPKRSTNSRRWVQVSQVIGSTVLDPGVVPIQVARLLRQGLEGTHADTSPVDLGCQGWSNVVVVKEGGVQQPTRLSEIET